MQLNFVDTLVILAKHSTSKIFEDHVASYSMWLLEVYLLVLEDVFEQDLYLSEHGGGMEPYFLFINPNKNCPDLERDFNRM